MLQSEIAGKRLWVLISSAPSSILRVLRIEIADTSLHLPAAGQECAATSRTPAPSMRGLGGVLDERASRVRLAVSTCRWSFV